MDDGAGRLGLVERIEMNAGSAFLQKFLALFRGVLDPVILDGFRILFHGFKVEITESEIRAPHIFVNRTIWLKFVIGMIPGMMGTRTPLSRIFFTKIK